MFTVLEIELKPVFMLFWQLCRLQRGPEDVPHSSPLLMLLLLAVMSLSVFIVVLFEPVLVVEKLMGSAASLIPWFVMVFLLLRFKRLETRYMQTMIACLGTDLIISLISVPMQAGIVNLEPETAFGTISRLGLLTLMIWDILVKGRIYSGALNIGRLQGNLLSICIWISMLLISFRFLPEAVQSTQ